jgi:hypothetical protein
MVNIPISIEASGLECDVRLGIKLTILTGRTVFYVRCFRRDARFDNRRVQQANRHIGRICFSEMLNDTRILYCTWRRN